jgi:F-type H+-transporting ATPase subunit delta
LIRQSIAKRYAKGLFAVGEKDGKYALYLSELKGILDLFAKEERIRRALMLPLIEIQKRKEILMDVMKALGVSFPVSNTMSMILERNRMGYLPLIKDVYSELVDEKEGRVRGTVWSAYPLEETVKSRIQDVMKERLKMDVVLTMVEDKTLIGGVKVMVRGTIIDGSVKRQLESLKENILKE